MVIHTSLKNSGLVLYVNQAPESQVLGTQSTKILTEHCRIFFWLLWGKSTYFYWNIICCQQFQKWRLKIKTLPLPLWWISMWLCPCIAIKDWNITEHNTGIEKNTWHFAQTYWAYHGWDKYVNTGHFFVISDTGKKVSNVILNTSHSYFF